MTNRYSRQRKYCTKKGLLVRSPGELEVANFLDDQGVRFEYEPSMTIDGYNWHPDFYLKDSGIYIEYFGMHSKDYRRNAWHKRQLIEREGLPLIPLYPKSKGRLGAAIKQGYEKITHRKFPQKKYFPWQTHSI
ncbi:MAG: hypothetical protein Q7S29_01950 [Candidatus Peribacter sp.]|nr:hypothetical protein [Candidatus Peribacter sp.]